ncbi:MAG: ParB/RepB/Spo0J family partition protein [Pyrinomonadaceae bacterium]
MPRSGLPTGVKMRHDSHYVDQIAARSRSVGRTIPIESIYPNPEQPRTEFGDLSDLRDSIKEKGVLEPLLVKPKSDGRFMIIAGERRWRASQLAGLSEVPCIEMDLDETSIAEIALIENLQRKDLTIWEEADALAMLGEKFGYTHDQIAQKISKSRSTVTELLAISGLPHDIRSKCNQAKITSKTTLLEIARQFDEAAMFDYLDRFSSGKPKKRTPAAEAQSGKTAAEPKAPVAGSEKTFSYSSPKGDFTLDLSFSRPGFARADILKALKQAFDDVKNNGL